MLAYAAPHIDRNCFYGCHSDGHLSQVDSRSNSQSLSFFEIHDKKVTHVDFHPQVRIYFLRCLTPRQGFELCCHDFFGSFHCDLGFKNPFTIQKTKVRLEIQWTQSCCQQVDFILLLLISLACSAVFSPVLGNVLVSCGHDDRIKVFHNVAKNFKSGNAASEV